LLTKSTFKLYKMNLGTYLKSEIVVFVPGLNSNVSFCVVKIGSIFQRGLNLDLSLSYYLK
jgi:hypothetical protein